MIKSFIKRNKYLFTFLSVIFLISIISGIIIFYKLNDNTKLDLINNISNIKDSLLNTKINNIFKHQIILILIILLSFSSLGYFLGIIYLFYEGMSISFTSCILFKIYTLKGLIFTLLYNILFKLIYIILLIMILVKTYYISKSILSYFIYKNTINIKKIIKSLIVLLIIVLINDLFIYYLSNFIMKILINML